MKAMFSMCLLAFTIAFTTAQNVKFAVEVSNDTLLVGNYFELKYTIENASPGKFEPPALKSLHIIGGPNTSTHMKYENGVMNQSSSYTYFIEPQDIGSYTIPPAFLKTDEGNLEAPPIDILVLPNPEGIVQQPHLTGKKIEQVNEVPPDEKKSKRPRKKF